MPTVMCVVQHLFVLLCCVVHNNRLQSNTMGQVQSQYYGRSRQCGCPVGARYSMGLGRNPLINGLTQHTFKFNL